MKIARRFNGGKGRRETQSPRRGRLNPQRTLMRQPSRNTLQFLPMSHRYARLLVHSIFSTKNREPIIPQSTKPRLWAYIGGIARTNGFKALAVGGMEDHVHVLFSLPATLAVAKVIQLIKGGSSKWMNDRLDRRSFAWQDSYGAFSIGISQVESTIRYINNQERHHARVSFEDEFRKILQRHGVQEYRG